MVEALHKNFVSLFGNKGYRITLDCNEDGVAMSMDEEFIFLDSINGERIKATLCFWDKNFLVSYNVFTGEYRKHIFINTSANQEKALFVEEKLKGEVERLALTDFIGAVSETNDDYNNPKPRYDDMNLYYEALDKGCCNL